MESAFSIAPENMTKVVQEQFLADPQLWHPDTPNLYTMVSRVYVDDMPVDTLRDGIWNSIFLNLRRIRAFS